MVSESTLFCKFNPARLLNLRDRLEFVSLEKDDVLFREGDSIDSFFILAHGELIERTSADAQGHLIRRTVFELNPGSEQSGSLQMRFAHPQWLPPHAVASSSSPKMPS